MITGPIGWYVFTWPIKLTVTEDSNKSECVDDSDVKSSTWQHGLKFWLPH